jgi:superfamily I DNA and/or RNA helicase
MKKDIEIKKVEGIGIAILPQEGGTVEDMLWDVYLLNLKQVAIEGVIVNSKGYGHRQEELVETGTFRYLVKELPAFSAVLLEPIQSDLFDLAHEFFIIFKEDDYMYDKKYVFVPGSIDLRNFTTIPILDRPGVMIK